MPSQPEAVDLMADIDGVDIRVPQPEKIDAEFGKKHVVDFARSWLDAYDAFFENEVQEVGTPEQRIGLQTQFNCQVTIPFAGTVWGNYVICFDEESASRLFKLIDSANPSEDEIKGARYDLGCNACELLNAAVGGCIEALEEYLPHLTFSPPHITYGYRTYPDVQSTRVSGKIDNLEFECHFFVDQMRLKIADSLERAVSTARMLNQVASKMKAQVDTSSKTSEVAVISLDGDVRCSSLKPTMSMIDAQKTSSGGPSVIHLLRDLSDDKTSLEAIEKFFKEVAANDSVPIIKDPPVTSLPGPEGSTIALQWFPLYNYGGKDKGAVMLILRPEAAT